MVGCECVCDELKVKNPEKKFGMAVDVRFLDRLHAIGAHGCGYRTRGVAIKTSCFVARLLVHCINRFVIWTKLCHVSCRGVNIPKVYSSTYT